MTARPSPDTWPRRAGSVALVMAVLTSGAVLSAQSSRPPAQPVLPAGVGPSVTSAVPPGELSQMSGQPLFVDDLPPGTVTVRVVRGTMDAVVAKHRVELQGPGKMLVASTDEEGRAQFDSLPAGTLTQAFTTLDGQQLMSAAFPVPAQGGTRILLARAEHASATGPSPLPLLSSAAEVPYGASPLAQMAGLPLQVGDLPPGTVSVRLLRGGFESPIVGHDVELHTGGDAQVLRVKTDAEGRAVFPPLAVGAVVYARSVVESEPLESQAFPLPERGGVRMILVAGAAPAPIGSQTASMANAPSPGASAWPARGGVVATSEPEPTATSASGPSARIVIALGCFAAASAVVLMSRRRRHPRIARASDSVRN